MYEYIQKYFHKYFQGSLMKFSKKVFQNILLDNKDSFMTDTKWIQAVVRLCFDLTRNRKWIFYATKLNQVAVSKEIGNNSKNKLSYNCDFILKNYVFDNP